MRGDAEPVDQPLVIETRSARARDRDAADAVGPDFARVRGDLIAVGGVGGGEGEHGLFLCAHLVDRGADFGKRHLSAAEEAVEVEHDRGHAIVAGGDFERVDDVADADLLELGAARECRERVDFGGLFADDPVELDDERTLADRQARVGAPGEQAEQRDEEQQQEDQRERILDPDEQVPDLAREAGRGFALVVAGQRPAHGDGPGAGGIVGRVRGAVGHVSKPRDAPRPWQCTLRRAGNREGANVGSIFSSVIPAFAGMRVMVRMGFRGQSQPSRRYQRTVSASASSVPSSGRHSSGGGHLPSVATQSGCAI